MKKLLSVVAVCLVMLLPSVALRADEDVVRLGVFADLHAHDANSPLDDFLLVDWEARLSACVDAMLAWPADLMIQLGDLVNGRFVLGGSFVEQTRIAEILEATEAVYARFPGPRHHVLGNHDVGDLTKAEFLERVNVPSLRYSFDVGGFHFVILDAQFRPDGSDRGMEFWYMPGTLPSSELDWLRDDLNSSELPTIVFIHQRLDVAYEFRHGGPQITNYLEVRDLLTGTGNVVAVFQGHDHEGGYSFLDGIHYVTFNGLLGRISGKEPTWAHVTLNASRRTITIDGGGEQADYELEF